MGFVLAIGAWAFLSLIAGLVTGDREVTLGSLGVLVVCWVAAVVLARCGGALVADEPEIIEDWDWPRRAA
jgi:hypothetical protein